MWEAGPAGCEEVPHHTRTKPEYPKEGPRFSTAQGIDKKW